MGKQVSPLRYPGGKAKLYNYIADIIRNLFVDKPVYCEPYAGGFGLGLELLFNNVVNSVIINDFDYCIYSFWKCLVDDSLYEDFIERIIETPITVHEWEIQKDIYRHYSCYPTLDIGFATFFLNRCNRSGILEANPIGGIKQSGKYHIDCRFNKTNLINVIKRIHGEKNRIQVMGKDAMECIHLVDDNNTNVLFNLDPPYITAGPLLYKNNYSQGDHIALGKAVKNLRNRWIMTYDDNPLIRDIYRNNIIRDYTLKYSLEQKRKGRELIIYDNRFVNPPVLDLYYEKTMKK